MGEKHDDIALAHQIATLLWDEGRRGADGAVVMAMALGIYMEAQEDGHRDFKIISDVMFREARKVFDLFKASKGRRPGHG